METKISRKFEESSAKMVTRKPLLSEEILYLTIILGFIASNGPFLVIDNETALVTAARISAPLAGQQTLQLGVVLSIPLLFDSRVFDEDKIHATLRLILLVSLIVANGLKLIFLHATDVPHGPLLSLASGNISPFAIVTVILLHVSQFHGSKLTAMDMAISSVTLIASRALNSLHILNPEWPVIFDAYLVSLCVGAMWFIRLIAAVFLHTDSKLTRKYDFLYIVTPIVWLLSVIGVSFYTSGTLKHSEQSEDAQKFTNLVNAAFTLLIVIVSGKYCKQDAEEALTSSKRQRGSVSKQSSSESLSSKAKSESHLSDKAVVPSLGSAKGSSGSASVGNNSSVPSTAAASTASSATLGVSSTSGPAASSSSPAPPASATTAPSAGVSKVKVWNTLSDSGAAVAGPQMNGCSVVTKKSKAAAATATATGGQSESGTVSQVATFEPIQRTENKPLDSASVATVAGAVTDAERAKLKEARIQPIAISRDVSGLPLLFPPLEDSSSAPIEVGATSSSASTATVSTSPAAAVDVVNIPPVVVTSTSMPAAPITVTSGGRPLSPPPPPPPRSASSRSSSPPPPPPPRSSAGINSSSSSGSGNVGGNGFVSVGAAGVSTEKPSVTLTPIKAPFPTKASPTATLSGSGSGSGSSSSTLAALTSSVRNRAVTPTRRQHHIETSGETVVTPVNSPKEEYVRSLTVVNVMQGLVQQVVTSSPERRASFSADQLNPKPTMPPPMLRKISPISGSIDGGSGSSSGGGGGSGSGYRPLLQSHNAVDAKDESVQLEHQALVAEELKNKKEQIRLRRAAAQAAKANGQK